MEYSEKKKKTFAANIKKVKQVKLGNRIMSNLKIKYLHVD